MREKIIVAGSRLFHGTSEEDFDNLDTVSHGGILWTASTPDISQCYIPISGSATMLSARHLSRPVRDPKLQRLQAYIGIVYDYSPDGVEWGGHGDQTKSFPSPVVEGKPRTSDNWDLPEAEDVARLLAAKGWKPYRDNGGPQWDVYEIHSGRSINDFILYGEKIPGRLFIITTTSDLRVFDYASEREGDLMEPDYNKFNLFARLGKEGYDGVLINDWCQSRVQGNYGHRSLGLFPTALNKISYTSVVAVHHDCDNEYGDFTTPEWRKYCTEKGIDPVLTRSNVPFL